jgi:hypothetical protein
MDTFAQDNSLVWQQQDFLVISVIFYQDERQFAINEKNILAIHERFSQVELILLYFLQELLFIKLKNLNDEILSYAQIFADIITNVV